MEPSFVVAEPDVPAGLSKPQNGPVFAQALWIFGAVLWGYVVIGEFVTSHGLPEWIAAPGLLALLAITAFVALEAPRSNRAGWLRNALPVAAAIGLFGLTLLFTISLAQAARAPAGAMSVALWFIAAFALFAGRQRARRDRPREAVSLRHYFAWAACGVLTLFALLSGL